MQIRMDACEADAGLLVKAYSPSSDDTTDPCERLVSFLEWASANHDTLNVSEQLSAVFDKGSLYRGFVSLDGLSLVEQILYLFQKFNEYNERLIVIDQDLSLGRGSHVECVTALSEFVFTQLLHEQQQSTFGNALLVELQSVYVMASVVANDIIIVLHREAGGDVFTATLSTTSKDQFVQAFVACVLPFLPPQTDCENVSQEGKQDNLCDDEIETEKDALSLANIAWLVRINGTFESNETNSNVDQDLLDEQVLHLTQHLRTLRQKECQHRIESLRTGLLSIRHALVTAVEADKNPQLLKKEEDQPGDAGPDTEKTTREKGSPAHLSSPPTTAGTKSAEHVEVFHETGDDQAEELLAAEQETDEENEHARGAAEALLLGSTEDATHQDKETEDPFQHNREQMSDDEEEDENTHERLSESPEDQFAQMMGNLDRYGANITHTQVDVERSTEIERSEHEQEDEERDRDVNFVAEEPSPPQEHISHEDVSHEQHQDDSMVSPQEDLESSPEHHFLPHEDLSHPVATEVEEPEVVEVSRTLFPNDGDNEAAEQGIYEHNERERPSPEAPVVFNESTNLREDASPVLPPPAMSVESPHVAQHLENHVTNAPGSIDNDGLPAPLTEHHSSAREQPAMAEPLSSSVVADLMSSVGDESQSVDFSHYLHRAYELIKEHAVHDALEQEEEQGGESEEDENEENDDEDAESRDPDQDESMMNMSEQEEKNTREGSDIADQEHARNYGVDVTSLLVSPIKLRDQLPQDSPMAPTPPVAATAAGAAQSRPATAMRATEVASPVTSPHRNHSTFNAVPAPAYDPTDDSVMDLVPVPFSHRSVSPTSRPGSSREAAATTGLRPLTASMVDALSSSGTALESTAAIEDYSAAAYQMFKNRAFADMYDNAASCEFENINGESFADEEECEPRAESEEIEDKGEASGDRGERDDEMFGGRVSLAEEGIQEVEEVRVNGDVDYADSTAVEDLLLGTKYDSDVDVQQKVSTQERKEDVAARNSSAAAATATSAQIQLKKEATLQEAPPLMTPVLTPEQVATLSAKLHNLRAQVEQEVENDKAKKNRYRMEVGKRVLALLFAEKVEPDAAPTDNVHDRVGAHTHETTANHAPEPPIRDVSVRSHGISFTAAPDAAPLAEKPVLSSHFRAPHPSHGASSISPQGVVQDDGKASHRAGGAGASRLPRPAPSEIVLPSDSPHKYSAAIGHHALPPPPHQNVSQHGSPYKLSFPAQAFAPASVATTAPAPPPRLRLNQAAGVKATAAASGDAENPTPRSARTDLSSLPPAPTSARAQSAGRAGRKLSNYAQIKNAINSVCMAGSHFDAKRIEVFEILDYFRFGKQMSAASEEQFVNDFSFLESANGAVAHFMIMFFQSKTLSFKGIYAADPATGAYMRVFGKGPKEFSDGSIPVQQFLKFETPSKSFKQIHVKNFSHNVDAFILDAVAFKSRT